MLQIEILFGRPKIGPKTRSRNNKKARRLSRRAASSWSQGQDLNLRPPSYEYGGPSNSDWTKAGPSIIFSPTNSPISLFKPPRSARGRRVCTDVAISSDPTVRWVCRCGRRPHCPSSPARRRCSKRMMRPLQLVSYDVLLKGC